MQGLFSAQTLHRKPLWAKGYGRSAGFAGFVFDLVEEESKYLFMYGPINTPWEFRHIASRKKISL
jgi:hypothetical protein